MNSAPERPLNAQQVADRLGMSVNTIRKWRHKGEGPRAFKVGTSVRWRPEDVDAWLAKENQS